MLIDLVPDASSKVELPSLPRGWHALRHTILSNGGLAMIGTDVDLAREHRRIHAGLGKPWFRFRRPRLDKLVAKGMGRIWEAGPAGWTDGPTFALETPYPLIERFGDGRWLVTASRTQGQANARVLTANGELLERIMLGDGIEDIAIDALDRIWVGWFDEGVLEMTAGGCPAKNGRPQVTASHVLPPTELSCHFLPGLQIQDSYPTATL